MRAVLSHLRGSVIKNWRTRKVSHGPPKKAGTISGLKKALIQLRYLKRINCGISVTWGGNIIVASMIRKSVLRPHQRRRAKENATSVIDMTLPTMLNPVITTEFQRYWQKIDGSGCLNIIAPQNPAGNPLGWKVKDLARWFERCGKCPCQWD